MSSDTANLLREHVKATADLLTNAKPDREENDGARGTSNARTDNTDSGKKGQPKPSQ